MVLTLSVLRSVRMLHASGKLRTHENWHKLSKKKTGTNNKGDALAQVTGRGRDRTGLRFD